MNKFPLYDILFYDYGYMIGVCLIYFCFRMLFQNGEYFNCDGVQIRAPGFGDTSSVDYLDPYNYLIPYFHEFIKFFSKYGYVKGVSLRAAPYDWRLTPGSNHSNHYRCNLLCCFL